MQITYTVESDFLETHEIFSIRSLSDSDEGFKAGERVHCNRIEIEAYSPYEITLKFYYDIIQDDYYIYNKNGKTVYCIAINGELEEITRDEILAHNKIL